MGIRYFYFILNQLKHHFYASGIKKIRNYSNFINIKLPFHLYLGIYEATKPCLSSCHIKYTNKKKHVLSPNYSIKFLPSGWLSGYYILRYMINLYFISAFILAQRTTIFLRNHTRHRRVVSYNNTCDEQQNISTPSTVSKQTF